MTWHRIDTRFQEGNDVQALLFVFTQQAVGLIVLVPADAFPAAQVRLQNFEAILRAEGVTKVVKLDSGQSILVTINRRNSWQPSLVEAGSDKSSENLMMIGACADSMDYCDTVYRFSWQYEYMNSGFTAPEVVTLETVSVSSKTAGRGCWISVNGTATYLDLCDVSALMPVPVGDPRAPLFNLTAEGKLSLTSFLSSIVPKKVLQCVRPSVNSMSDDAPVQYAYATQAARTQLAGKLKGFNFGDLVDVQYKNGTSYTFSIISCMGCGDQGVEHGDFRLDRPSVTLLSSTQCWK